MQINKTVSPEIEDDIGYLDGEVLYFIVLNTVLFKSPLLGGDQRQSTVGEDRCK